MTTESSPSNARGGSDYDNLRRTINLAETVYEERLASATPFTKKQSAELYRALDAMHQLLLTYRGGSPHDAPATEAEGK